ncbi:host attachment protein [Thalassospiraceae bacterium LMO-SO8]|nr:host attachment protein [Alphaproteobacteria bacterium LMO-S08]WND75258.1 host attachment protein [Thalassospiraceae bacterium LMO-SO8]
MKKTVTWIVVADHQQARAYAHDGPGRGIRAADGFVFDTHLDRSHDIMTDRPGRKPGTGGSQRSVGARSDPHREAGRQFMQNVANAIADASHAKAFSRLIVVAPPRALGELRTALPDNVRAKVIAEINEDLTKASQADLADRLGDVLAV